jgi:predicted thioredoxin/glutaredoxin
VDASLSKPQRHFLVQDGRHGSHCHVDSLLNQFLNCVVDSQAIRNIVWIAERIRDSNQVNAIKLADYAGMVATHHAQSDEACAEVCH